jgi:hypothetical protein
VASTCQEYHTLVNENDATIWKALYQTGGNEDVVLKHLFGKNLAVLGFNETSKQLGTWQKWLQA